MKLVHGTIAAKPITHAAIHKDSIIHGMTTITTTINSLNLSKFIKLEKTFYRIAGVLSAKDLINGEHAVIDTSQLATVVAVVVLVVMYQTITIAIKRRHHQYHIQQISEKEQIPVTHIISNHLGRVVCKISKILHQLDYGQSHIYTVQGHQTQRN